MPDGDVCLSHHSNAGDGEIAGHSSIGVILTCGSFGTISSASAGRYVVEDGGLGTYGVSRENVSGSGGEDSGDGTTV